MNNPFELLAVSADATDEAIKKAYLQKVKEYPPDQAPEQFQAIRRAYEAIQNHKARLAYTLFHIEPPNVDVLSQTLLQNTPTQRPDEALFMRMLAECLNGE